ncbi:MAG: DUF2911 domain-containing protein [Bacteroidia bacterium]|nr:DUF2911 domain-containing protein [Bacteroidia bacterium]MBT8270268.1 DUF2911 domain-containing protein [Bacteroidia bacterium]MBT8288654.1 DUF2911 domain-containing protein [Bacteroidia bacterium]NNF81969.1 DUF2911 domain-containing protein [Flavobacteriaceae bacterium]
MNLFLKRIIVVLVVIAVGIFGYIFFSTNLLKSRLSPKDTVEFKLNDLELEVFYNRPSKRDRVIFGGLVPYDLIWRTGANEATTFETNRDLIVNGEILLAGLYTLWTIPGEENWTVIFNTKQYPWGVDETMQPMREAHYDAIQVEVPVQKLDQVVEQFTIAFDNSTDNLSLTMAWDQTKISVPLK